VIYQYSSSTTIGSGMLLNLESQRYRWLLQEWKT